MVWYVRAMISLLVQLSTAYELKLLSNDFISNTSIIARAPGIVKVQCYNILKEHLIHV